MAGSILVLIESSPELLCANKSTVHKNELSIMMQPRSINQDYRIPGKYCVPVR
jgi:hypothetical protein